MTYDQDFFCWMIFFGNFGNFLFKNVNGNKACMQVVNSITFCMGTTYAWMEKDIYIYIYSCVPGWLGFRVGQIIGQSVSYMKKKVSKNPIAFGLLKNCVSFFKIKNVHIFCS
jgi:hypothetical protein